MHEKNDLPVLRPGVECIEVRSNPARRVHMSLVQEPAEKKKRIDWWETAMRMFDLIFCGYMTLAIVWFTLITFGGV